MEIILKGIGKIFCPPGSTYKIKGRFLIITLAGECIAEIPALDVQAINKR